MKKSTKTSLNTITTASDHRPCEIKKPVCNQMLTSDAEGARKGIATKADESFQLHGETDLLTDKLQQELNLARKSGIK